VFFKAFKNEEKSGLKGFAFQMSKKVTDKNKLSRSGAIQVTQ